MEDLNRFRRNRALDVQLDVAIAPAGDVWVTNNWQYWPATLERVEEALSTLGGGQGMVVFYRMAKPVGTPLVGPQDSRSEHNRAMSLVGQKRRFDPPPVTSGLPR
jgi:hypothetical protein